MDLSLAPGSKETLEAVLQELAAADSRCSQVLEICSIRMLEFLGKAQSHIGAKMPGQAARSITSAHAWLAQVAQPWLSFRASVRECRAAITAFVEGAGGSELSITIPSAPLLTRPHSLPNTKEVEFHRDAEGRIIGATITRQ